MITKPPPQSLSLVSNTILSCYANGTFCSSVWWVHVVRIKLFWYNYLHLKLHVKIMTPAQLLILLNYGRSLIKFTSMYPKDKSIWYLMYLITRRSDLKKARMPYFILAWSICPIVHDISSKYIRGYTMGVNRVLLKMASRTMIRYETPFLTAPESRP